MLQKVLELLHIACSHPNTSKPFTAAPVARGDANGEWEAVGAAPSASHYVVCLECGKKMGYDWEHMRIVR